ncbi:MAG TPA: carboxypeptidase-like regulatory domain-containing protein, partial [Bacillota bacterium]|nr:carboxypeptidase-like regulatory domain-containing protein [Bacillota bacterium]
IALYYASNLFSGTLAALGGAGAPSGGAGTIYSRANNQSAAQVVLDNGGLSGMSSSLGSSLSSSTDLILQDGAILGLRSSLTLRNLIIRSNSWLTFSNSSPLTLTGDATIQTGGGIVADGAGYGAGQGPGAGGSLSSGSSGPNGGGGGHGGFGAASAFGAGGGNAYDPLLTPSLAGSGGGNGLGNSPYNRGGAGGGIINLHIIGNLQNDGRISADGTAGGAPSSGGGSGGSLLLWARTLSGSGAISANGGAGNGWGGGGGGGRIAISCVSNLSSGLISAFGGSGADWGGAGTIFLASSYGWNHGQVLVDNGGHFGTNTAIAATDPIDLVVQRGANAAPASGYLLLSNLVVRADGTLTSSGSRSNLDIAVLGDALVEPGGLISVDGLGFAQNVGPGSGLSSNFVGSGAGYGGAGGAAPFLAGGTVYGSAQHPVDFGSGGGLGWGPLSGGQGGGALRLSVSGALTLNGQLSANGNPGSQDDAGGGSGGSIWLSAGSLVGNGSLSAAGGSGELYQGGGGGGGRISLYTPTNSFTGSVSAAGGLGWSNGSTGSVFFATNFDLPVLVAQSPVGVVSNAISFIDLTFNNPVNPDAVWYPGFFLDTPIGTIPGAEVYAAAQGTSTLRFYLPLQTAVGDYTLRVSHALVWDIFGQSLAADYTNSFTIVLPLIEGRIFDTNGLPVPGVVVQPNPGSPATTDANGYYALGAPLGLSFSVTPAKTGLMFVPGTRYYTNVTGGSFSQDYLAVSTIAPVVQTDCGATNLVMNWLGISGVSYQPYASTNLVDWYPCSDLLLGTNGPMRLELPVGTEPCLFYRLGASN